MARDEFVDHVFVEKEFEEVASLDSFVVVVSVAVSFSFVFHLEHLLGFLGTRWGIGV